MQDKEALAPLQVVGITDSEHDKYRQLLRQQLADIDGRLSMLQDAEDNYYITAKYVLEISSRAYELFKSSEVEERRQLIKLVLSNTRIEGKKVRFEAQKPFNQILDFADRQAWLPLLNVFRNREIEFDFSFGYIKTVLEGFDFQPIYT